MKRRTRHQYIFDLGDDDGAIVKDLYEQAAAHQGKLTSQWVRDTLWSEVARLIAAGKITPNANLKGRNT